jgi:hypothetical protein
VRLTLVGGRGDLDRLTGLQSFGTTDDDLVAGVDSVFNPNPQTNG